MENIKKRLELQYDEKAIAAVQERYIFALQDKHSYSRMDQRLMSHKYEHHQPNHLFASNTELKFHLKTLANEYGLNFS